MNPSSEISNDIPEYAEKCLVILKSFVHSKFWKFIQQNTIYLWWCSLINVNFIFEALEPSGWLFGKHWQSRVANIVKTLPFDNIIWFAVIERKKSLVYSIDWPPGDGCGISWCGRLSSKKFCILMNVFKGFFNIGHII